MGRRQIPRTPEQEQRLAAVEAAREQLDAADAHYRAAMLAADASGATLAAIGQAAKISTESARRYLGRHRQEAVKR